MSASTTPTDRPRAASAAARLTVTLDLPTPPLPLATAYTLVREPGWANGMTGSAAARRRAGCVCRSLRCSAVITPKSISTAGDPGDRADRGGDVGAQLVLQRAAGDREQQPDHGDAVGGDRRRTRTMPSSVIGRRISGSSTVARAAWIAASTVVAGADMPAMVRRHSRLFRGPTAGGNTSHER